MTPSAQELYARRELNLRVSWISIAFVIVGLVLARWYVYFDLAALILPLALFVIDLACCTILLRRLFTYGDSPQALRLFRLSRPLQVLAELLLITWAVNLTGGVTSPAAAVYIIYIFAAGLYDSLPAVIAYGVLAALLYTGMVLGEYYGIIPHRNIGLFPESQFYLSRSYVDSALIFCLTLMAVTLVISVVLKRGTQAREKQLADSAEQLSERVREVQTLRGFGGRLTSSLDVNAVLDAVGENALQLIKATDAHVFLYDQDTGHFTSGVGVWSDGHRGTVVKLPRTNGFSATIVQTKTPLILNDPEDHPLFRSLEARSWGIRAIAGLPLIKADRVLGVLNVAFLEPHQFNREEEEALRSLADQAAIAVDNARLYGQVERKILELSALYAVAQSTTQLGDLTALLNEALGVILPTVGADAGMVARLDEQREELIIVAHRGLSPAGLNEVKTRRLSSGDGYAEEAILKGQPIRAIGIGTERNAEGLSLNPDGYQTVYALPLRAQNRVIGVLELLWKDKHETVPTEENLIGAIGPQLAVAISNATLYAETKRRAEELATLRAVGLATTSTLNLREQLRLLYENVKLLLKADAFFVGLYDDIRRELRIEYIVEDGWFLRPISVPLDQAGLSGWVIENQKPLRVPDLTTADKLPASPIHITRPARSWLGVPLQLKERIIGLISAQSFTANTFSPEDERFLVAVAQHVALAFDNARLFGESERRTRELTLLNEISRAISASLDLDVILERTARALSEQLGYRFVSIYLLEDQALNLKAQLGYEKIDEAWPVSRGVMGRVARTRRSAFITNVANDPDYVPLVPDVVAEICVPIERDGRVLGVVDVEETRVGTLKEDDLALLNVLSDQLAIAATNATLYREALGRERFATRLGQLGMSLTSTLDLSQLVDTLCRESLTLFAVDTAAIFLREDDKPSDSTGQTEQGAEIGYHLVCRTATGEGRSILIGTTAGTEQPFGLVTRTARMGRGFVIHDAQSTVLFGDDDSNSFEAKALLSVPILKEREVIGVLVLFDLKNASRFGDADLARATIVAAQAGLALSNARLYQETQRRAAEQTSLYEIGLAVSATLNLDEQLKIIYEQIVRHFDLQAFYVALRSERADILSFPFFVMNGEKKEAFERSVSDAGLAGWILEHRRALVVGDLQKDVEHLPTMPGEISDRSGPAAFIGIPLLVKSDPIGVLALERSALEPFTPEEQRFLLSLTQQVAFAVDNARLHQQAQRTGAQQALLYQASRRIAGALNLETLLGAIVEALNHDLGYHSVTVFLADEEAEELIAAAGSPDIGGLVASNYRQKIGRGMLGQAVLDGLTLLASDTRTEPNFIALDGHDPHSQLVVPIKSADLVIGLINIESEHVNAFADSDIRMFEAVADQLAVAIENAKLYAQAQERLARINALQNIEVSILSTPDLGERLDLILGHALTQMNADIGFVFLRDPVTFELSRLWQRGARHPNSWQDLRLNRAEGAAGWVVENAEPLMIRDVQMDPRWTQTKVSEREEISSYLGVPLKVERQVIGVLEVATRTPRVFNEEEINYFTLLASHAAVAIENARLYEQTRSQLEQLRDTQGRLIESERRAAIGELTAGLAHEINNPLTAILGHTQLLLESQPTTPIIADSWRAELDTISLAAQRIARIVQEFIKVSHVEGSHSEHLDLRELIREEAVRFEARDDAQDVALMVTLPESPQWVSVSPPLIDQVLTNILNNSLEAMPHGGTVDIVVSEGEGKEVLCSIRDSGYGIAESDIRKVFEPGFTTKVESGVVRGIGLGLYTADRIIKSHGGSIWVTSQPGQHTTVTFTLPRVMEEPPDAS